MFTNQEIEEACGEGGLRRVLLKVRGGAAGQRGTRYEDYFAVAVTLEGMAAVLQGTVGATTRVIGQVLAFIDDVAVVEEAPRAASLHQCKNTTAVSWGEGPGSVQEDFAQQMRLNAATGTDGRGVLVVADAGLASRLQEALPADLAGFAEVRHFPWHPGLAAYALDAGFAAAADRILARAGAAEREILARAVLARWCAADAPLALGPLLQALADERGLFVVPEAPPPVPPTLAAKLDTIPGLVWRVERGYIHWHYPDGGERGTLPFHCGTETFARFTGWVAERSRLTFDDLLGWLA